MFFKKGNDSRVHFHYRHGFHFRFLGGHKCIVTESQSVGHDMTVCFFYRDSHGFRFTDDDTHPDFVIFQNHGKRNGLGEKTGAGIEERIFLLEGMISLKKFIRKGIRVF